MATVKWRGDAPAVAQVNTITPASVGVGNTFTVTINGKSITYTAAVATVADVTAGLAALIAATTIAEFLELKVSDNTTNLTLTASVPGVPFTQTSSASGGTATNTTSTTTASSGPNDFSVAANFSGGALPSSGDDLYIPAGRSGIYYGLGQSAIVLGTLYVDLSDTIGLPLINAGGYIEYRKTRLEIGAGTVNVGKFADAGGGSTRIRLDLGANTTTINVYNTSSPTEGFGALDVKGNGGNTYTCNLYKGSIAFATEPGDVAVLAINQSYLQNQAGDVSLYLGAGVTLTSMSQAGGDVTVMAGFTTYVMTAGTMTIIGTGAGTTLTIDGGTVYDRSSGTFTTTKVGTDGVYDRTVDKRSKTMTNLTLLPKSTFLDPNNTITFTNPFALDRCALSELTIDLGTNFNLQRS